jgi:hypothetical protein
VDIGGPGDYSSTSSEEQAMTGDDDQFGGDRLRDAVFAGKGPCAKPGLGTRIIQGLVEQLGASIETQDAAPGHRAVIRMPLETT